ncbi:MAG: transaldolase family protein [Phycisphaerae bacterium]|nr:transaldolase family protein [Phycisphaerae bacterium]
MTSNVPASVIERLAESHPEMEVWFDSSPLIFKSWRDQVVAEAEPAKRDALRVQLNRLYPFDAPATCLFRGVTTNPPLSLQAIQRDPETWDKWVREEVKKHPDWDGKTMFWHTYREVVRCGAEMLKPIFEASGYKNGYISGQVDPRILTDTDEMVRQGLELNDANPNVMIKMPGTRQGIEGIERLTAMGIPTNATLTFATSQLFAVAEAVKSGLAKAKADGVDLTQWRSVVTMMLGRMEDHPVFKEQAEGLGIELSDADLRWAGLAIFKKTYKILRDPANGYSTKMLAASMRVGPKVDGQEKVWHLEKLTGGAIVLTVFPNIFEAFLKDYKPEEIKPLMDEPVPDDVIEKLSKIPYFRQAYDEDGLEPDEWIDFAPVVATGDSFSDATNELEQWVTQRVEEK